jgi:hypothetical protein
MADETYPTLTTEDKLRIARDVLRGRETDRFRISLLNEPGKEERLANYDAEIAVLLEVVAELEAEVAAESEPVVEN